MKNRKVARILLWLILAITLSPVVLRFFMPATPNWVVGIGIVYAAICTALLLPKIAKVEQLLQQLESRKYLFAILVAAQFATHSTNSAYSDWTTWLTLAIVLPLIVLLETRKEKKAA